MAQPDLGNEHYLRAHGARLRLHRRPFGKLRTGIVDWFTRRVLAWRVSISLDAGFCIEALEEALARYGKPAIFNSDQGSQFASAAFTAVLLREQMASAWTGKAAGATTCSLSASGAQ